MDKIYYCMHKKLCNISWEPRNNALLEYHKLRITCFVLFVLAILQPFGPVWKSIMGFKQVTGLLNYWAGLFYWGLASLLYLLYSNSMFTFLVWHWTTISISCQKVRKSCGAYSFKYKLGWGLWLELLLDIEYITRNSHLYIFNFMIAVFRYC